jgi:hypothetical protein
MGSHPPRCQGPHLASLATDNQLPRIKPYSVRASTAYWLQVGMNRHVAGRSGDTMCLYSWIRKTSPRTVALPAPPITARARADCLTGWFPPTRSHVASRAAAVAPTASRTPADCSAAPGLPPDRIDGDRPTSFGRRAEAGAPPDGVPPPNQPAWQRSAQRADPRSRARSSAECERRRRAPRCASRTSPWRQTPLTASCGCVPEAPRKNLPLRSGR